MNNEPEKFETDAIESCAPAAESLSCGESEAAKATPSNEFFRKLMDRNFLEYARYVIKDRAIPDVDDGLKPVQRRILWAMHKTDDGRTHKAAFVVGEVMGKYHPHGDASIKDALVVLANKEYFIEKQGNFGNIITGSPAAASRYIECGLSELGREVLFNDDLTKLVETYDSEHLEPVVLPVRIPALLMLGTDGIAVGMSTWIPPHNFNELLNAQISCLKGEEFTLYPDFQQGGLMDVRDYRDGTGKITLRARIEIEGRKLIIREIPATTTTERLLESIERAVEKSKIKIASCHDYSTGQAEIEIVPTRGYDPEKTRQALYMYTDCSVSITPRFTVIRDRRPTVMTVSDIIRRNTDKLLEYLQKELESSLGKQNELFHYKTLAQIFFENRIYKRIEECKSEEDEYREVHSGLKPFREMLKRDITDEDVDRLLAMPVRRISRFDIEKNQTELREIEKKIAEIRRHLAHLVDYAIEYLQKLLDKYGSDHPRRTEIENLAKIDRQAAALNNIKIGWDRRAGYIGSSIKSDDVITCNEYDKLLQIRKDGSYRITELPGNKEFVDKLYECRRYDATQVFGVIYREKKSGKYYVKRTVIDKFITDKEYMLCPSGCKLELLATRTDAVWAVKEKTKRAVREFELNLMTAPLRSPKARGVLLSANPIDKLTQLRLLTPEELAAVAATEKLPSEDAAETPTAPENSASPAGQTIEVKQEKAETRMEASIPPPATEQDPPPQEEFQAAGTVEVIEPAKPAVKRKRTVHRETPETAPQEVSPDMARPPAEPETPPLKAPVPQPKPDSQRRRVGGPVHTVKTPDGPTPPSEPAASPVPQPVPDRKKTPKTPKKSPEPKKTGDDDDIVQPELFF